MKEKLKKFWSIYEAREIVNLLILFLAGFAGYYLFICIAGLTGSVYGFYPCLGAFAVFAVLAVVWLKGAGKTVFNENKAIFLIFGTSLALKLDYIYYTSCYMRQQDTLIFDVPMGHLGYIGYLYYNRHLPDFDTRTAWSFSHPPLHHIISAIWVRIGTKFGMDLYDAIEGIQILTVLYSCGILLFIYLILKELDIKGRILYAIMLLCAFHPTFIIMSGSINNDVLSVMFMTGAILYTIRWYRDSSMKNILILAVMIGCAMMSKVSTGLIAVGVAVVFLIKFIREIIREKTQWKSYFLKFVAFGVVVFPLGLWYPIRNNILFGVPLTYAEKLKLDSDQYIGNIDFMKRLTDFSSYQFKNLDVQFDAAGTYREFNVWIGLLKTTIFGYFDFYHDSRLLTLTGTILFWLNVALIALCAIGGIVTLAHIFTSKVKNSQPGAVGEHTDSQPAEDGLEESKSAENGIEESKPSCALGEGIFIEKLFFLMLFLTFMASYLKFCAEYPHICTMNIRYIIPVMLIGFFYLALAIKEGKEKKGFARYLARTGEIITLVIAVIWSVLSAVMFLALGLL